MNKFYKALNETQREIVPFQISGKIRSRQFLSFNDSKVESYNCCNCQYGYVRC